MRAISSTALAFVFVLRLASAADTSAASAVRNFGQVNDHLYRGAVPSPVAIQELGAMGIKMVIDLREPGEKTTTEQTLVEKLGIRYVNVPMRSMSAPTQEQIEHVLSLLNQHETDRVFVHCRRGKDRTGTVIACYRVQHDGWSNRKAQGEANEFGMSRVERGMRSFIVHFTPLNVASTLKTAN
ncbi:MAG TPA: tyrosine-protein phosphatase [Bryobacteraceae bacterium]|nr:tyrosine-protein phosphatase [Bryobacteraceae bacterium]